jgi:hypothetical protein
MIYGQAKEIIDEFADSRTLLNATLTVAGLLTVVSLATVLAGVLIWPAALASAFGGIGIAPIVLAGVGIVYLIGIAPLWGILKKPKTDVITINSPSRRKSFLESSKERYKELKAKRKEEEWKWYNAKWRSAFFARKRFRDVALVLIVIGWILSFILLIDTISISATASQTVSANQTTSLPWAASLNQMMPLFFLFLSLSILAFLLLGDRVGEDFSLSNRLKNVEVPLWGLFSEGICFAPKKVRVNDSTTVLIALERSNNFRRRFEELWPPETAPSAPQPPVLARFVGRFVSPVEEELAAPQAPYLEAELHAEGAQIDGESRLRLGKRSETALAIWSCCFPNAGNNEINVALNVVDPSDNTRQSIFSYRHDVKVESLLTSSWQPVLTALVSILTAILGIIQITKAI